MKKSLTLLSVLALIFFMVPTFYISCSDSDDDDDTATPTPTQPPEETVVRLTDDEPFEAYLQIWPDGSKVLFTQHGDNSLSQIYTVPTDGSGGKTGLGQENKTYYFADVHPAGTYVCYSTGEDDNALWEIGSLELGGSEAILTNNNANGFDSVLPVYSNDGSKIAYSRRSNSDLVDTLVLMNNDGSNPVEICTLPSGTNNLLYVMNWFGANDLIYATVGGKIFKVAATAGSSPVQLDSSNSYHLCTSNASGSKIICSEEGSIGLNYVTMDPDGSNKTVIADLSTHPMFASLYCMICPLADDSGLVALATEVNDENLDLFIINDVNL